MNFRGMGVLEDMGKNISETCHESSIAVIGDASPGVCGYQEVVVGNVSEAIEVEVSKGGWTNGGN